MTNASNQAPQIQRSRRAFGHVTGLCWYGVHALNPRMEDLDMALENAGYEFYDPRTTELRPVPKRQLTATQRDSLIPIMRSVGVQLFPGYRFVRLDLRDGRWNDLFRLIGIQGILGSQETGLMPCPFDDVSIMALKGVEVGGVIPGKTTIRQLAYKIGEEVRIRKGALANFSGVIEEIPDKPIEQLDGSARITLLVAVFGRASPVELTIDDIEKL